jgi:uncharacterized membrane protein (DUF373 family)
VSRSKNGKGGEEEARAWASRAFGLIEDGFYVAVATALSLAGMGLFVYAVYSFFDHIDDLSMIDNLLELLDGLLLVFIFTELIHTVRTIINEKVLVAEPFLIVGIVAAIRRMIVVSAKAKELLGKPDFADAMLEMAVLGGVTILLTLAVFLLRHTTHSEPRSAHEPGEDENAT